MNAIVSQNTSGRSLVPEPRSILSTRTDELANAISELEATVENAIDRLRPILAPYPTSMPLPADGSEKAPPMAPLVNFAQEQTSRVNALRHRISEAMANAQI